MTQTQTHTRRNFLGLAGAAAITPLFPAISQAQVVEILTLAASLEPIADLVDLGIDTYSASVGRPVPELKNITETSQTLVQSQEQILKEVRDLRTSIPQEIERAFRDNHTRQLQAEIDDFRILTANGQLPEADRNIYEKARRLERLGVTMADYGPSALPSFMAANALLYAVNRSLGRDANAQSLLYQSHASTLDNWLAQDESGIVRRYAEEFRLQLGRRLTSDSTSRIKTIDVGHADYRDGDLVQRSMLKLRIHQGQNGQITVNPVVYETSDIYPLNSYLVTHGLTEEDMPDKRLRYSIDRAPAEYINAFPFLQQDDAITRDFVSNAAQADDYTKSFLTSSLANPMQNTVNNYISNRDWHDGQFNDLKGMIDTIERISGNLKSAANDLTRAGLRPMPSLIRDLPRPRP